MSIPTYDIECLDWTTPVAVGFFDGTSYFEFLEDGTGVSPVLKFLTFLGQMYPGIHLYAHNAINFDNQFIIATLIRMGQRISFEGGMSRLVWTETGITFEDSYILLGRGLRAICEAFDVPRKLDWDHSTTKHLWELDGRLDSFREYLKRDCLALSAALSAYCKKLIDYFGITPSSTLSLTAVKAFNKGFYPVKSIQANDQYEKMIRKATYGGRNEVYKRYGEKLNLYDVRRMYTSCYDIQVPIGKMMWSTPNLDTGTLARAKVKVPLDSIIGPLPYRHHGRLIYPVGEFEGWWDTRLLDFVVTYCGVDLSIVSQLRADEEPILKTFGEYVQSISEGVNDQESRVWKLFALRLSGKFGQHRTSTEIKHITDIEEMDGWSPIDKEETYHERTVHLNGHRSPYIKPAINMRIRAEASRRHLAFMLRAGPENVYYCDTDSVYTTSKLPVGKQPGQLRLLDHAVRGYFIRPKLYGYVTADSTGKEMAKMKQRASGFHDFKLGESDFERLLRGEGIQNNFRSLGNWKMVLRGEDIRLIERQRIARSIEFDNRIVDGRETRPIRLPLRSEHEAD